MYSIYVVPSPSREVVQAIAFMTKPSGTDLVLEDPTWAGAFKSFIGARSVALYTDRSPYSALALLDAFRLAPGLVPTGGAYMVVISGRTNKVWHGRISSSCDALRDALMADHCPAFYH